MPATQPTAAEIAEAARHGMTYVTVRQPHGLTIGLGNGNYAFGVGDVVTVPSLAVRQLRIDGNIE